jgi:hypothetical protein
MAFAPPESDDEIRDWQTHHHSVGDRAASLAESCHAQATGGGSGGGRKRHEQKTDKSTTQTPKANDKAYNAALKSLPDKPFDPWRGAR